MDDTPESGDRPSLVRTDPDTAARQGYPAVAYYRHGGCGGVINGEGLCARCGRQCIVQEAADYKADNPRDPSTWSPAFKRFLLQQEFEAIWGRYDVSYEDEWEVYAKAFFDATGPNDPALQAAWTKYGAIVEAGKKVRDAELQALLEKRQKEGY